MGLMILDPEFLIEKKSKCSVQEMSNFGNLQKFVSNEKLPVITKVEKKEVVAIDAAGSCGECDLDHCKYILLIKLFYDTLRCFSIQ